MVELKLSKWQQQYLNHFDDSLYIACTAISAGKTRILAAWLVMQCIKKEGIRGIIIAQTYRALTKVLIHEILSFANVIGVHIEWNKGSQEIHFPNKSVLFGYSAENPNAVLGLSEISILAIDEAAYCNEEIYNNARDRMRGGKYPPMVRLISSPSIVGRVENWFSKICMKYSDKVITATYKDNPFTSEDFKKELEERYVIGSNLFRQQCLGEIFSTDVASQIIFRNQFPSEKKEDSTKSYYIGYDAAGLGSDNHEIVLIDKNGMVDYKEINQADTFQIVDIISKYYNTYKIKNSFADGTGGYSKGPVDVAKSKGIDIVSINFAQKAYNSELYPNARTEMYIELANAVKNGLWVNDIVKEEMLAQSVFINNRGQQQLVPKEDVKKVLGHSPDLCDAVALAVYAMNHSGINTEYDSRKAEQIGLNYLKWTVYGG